MQIPKIRFATRTTLHRGTAGQLIDWLELYVNALVPDNGIESWYVPRQRDKGDRWLARDDKLPESVIHVACYVTDGANEGRYLYVGLMQPSRGYVQIACAKSFGSAEECWALARICSEALTSIVWYREQPSFLELFLKLPRKKPWHRETSLTGAVLLRFPDECCVEVMAEDATVIDARRFTGPNAQHAVSAYAADWMTVLAAQELSIRFEADTLPATVRDATPARRDIGHPV